MKKFNNFYLLILPLLLIFSCQKTEIYNGSPVGKLQIETVNAVVTSSSTNALNGQGITFTATLPQSFRNIVNDTVNVEATTITKTGITRKKSVLFLPGQITVSGTIDVAGSNEFDSTFDLSLTAINLKKSIIGKQFLLTSNKLTIGTGSSSIPSENEKRLQVRISWENKNVANPIACKVFRLNSTSLTLKGSNLNSKMKISVAGIDYLTTLVTNLQTTATNFVNSTVIPGITLRSEGSTIFFDYTSSTRPVISTVLVLPFTTAEDLKGTRFEEIFINPDQDSYKTFFLTSSQIVSKTTFKPIEEGQNYAYNPGTYRIKIGVGSASAILDSNPLNLKYKIIIRFPDSSVSIIPGIYNGLTPTSAFKDILEFKKTGVGSAAIYDNFVNLNP